MPKSDHVAMLKKPSSHGICGEQRTRKSGERPAIGFAFPLAVVQQVFVERAKRLLKRSRSLRVGPPRSLTMLKREDRQMRNGKYSANFEYQRHLTTMSACFRPKRSTKLSRQPGGRDEGSLGKVGLPSLLRTNRKLFWFKVRFEEIAIH